MSDITINFYGGTQQVNPSATTAVQNFYGDQFAKEKLKEEAMSQLNLSPEAIKFSKYINKVEDLNGYISLLTTCKTASEVGEVIATMCENEPSIDSALIAKECFIRLLLPFIPNVEKGKGIDNLRIQIDKAWTARRKALRQQK